MSSEFYRMKDLGGGTVLDLGVYVIQLAQWAFQQVPKSITATGTLNSEGVDMATEVEINYGGEGENKRWAKLATSALVELKNTATITGTKGQIVVSILLRLNPKWILKCRTR